jgi:hypothetical protein
LNDQVFALFYFERQRGDKYLAYRADDRDILESNVGRLDDLASAGQNYSVFASASDAIGAGKLTFRVLLRLGRADQLFLEFPSLDLVHSIQQIRYSRGVACEFSQLLVAVHDPAKGIAGAEEQTSVGDKAFQS